MPGEKILSGMAFLSGVECGLSWCCRSGVSTLSGLYDYPVLSATTGDKAGDIIATLIGS
jgi:hypothetical protein